MVQVENTEDRTGSSGAQRRVKIVKVCCPEGCNCGACEVAHQLQYSSGKF